MSLVLNRRPGEAFIINRPRITVRVVSVKGNYVRFAIDAPRHIEIAREELTIQIPSRMAQDHKEVVT